MRRPLSIVLVFLLVLRGLLGDAMAMGAAPVAGLQVQAQAQAAPVQQAHHHAPELAQALAATASPESAHPGHAAHHEAGIAQIGQIEQIGQFDQHGQAAACGDGASAGCGGHEHGPSCTLCGICHSALYTPAGILPQGTLSACGPRAQGAERFASAAPRQACKPPIS